MGGLNKFSVWDHTTFSYTRHRSIPLFLHFSFPPHVFTPSNLIKNQGNTPPPPPPPHSAPTTADSSQIKTYRLPEAP